MSDISESIHQIVPQVYEQAGLHHHLEPGVNLAQSGQSQLLTHVLLKTLIDKGFPASREFHMVEDGPNDDLHNRRWHLVIAHRAPDEPASEDDIITDLNPWHFVHYPTRQTFLHGPRDVVKRELGREGAPYWYISLRGISSLVRSHTTDTTVRKILGYPEEPRES